MKISEGEVLYPYKLVIFVSIMVCILTAVLAWSIICIYKIFQRFKCSDKILLISTGCVIISLISEIIGLVMGAMEYITLS